VNAIAMATNYSLWTASLPMLPGNNEKGPKMTRPVGTTILEGQTPLEELGPEKLAGIFRMREHYEPFLRNARSLENRIWLLWHATYLEAFGRQVPYHAVPANIVAMLAKAIDEPRPAVPLVPRRRMTFSAHAEKVRTALGYRKLSGALSASILFWLTELAKRNDDPERLRQSLDERLRADKIVVPAQYRLERLLGKARNAGQQSTIAAVLQPLGREHRRALGRLRELRSDGQKSVLQWLKEPPAFSSPAVLIGLLDRIDFIRGLELPASAAASLHPDMRRRIAALVGRYSADSLFGDFPEPKRLAYLACYLAERLMALVDLSVECFDDLANGVKNRSENAMRKDQLGHGRAINDKLRMFETISAVLLDEATVPDDKIRSTVYAAISKDELRRAAEGCRELIRPADYNCVDYKARRYNYVRRFLPRFLRTVLLESTSEAAPVIDAVRAILNWDTRGLHAVPPDAPVAFVPKRWLAYVCPKDSQVDRRYYELCLLEVLQSSLRSGEVWSRDGRRYGSVEDLLIPLAEWSQVRDDCYRELGLPKTPKAWLRQHVETLDKTIRRVTTGLAQNTQVFIEGGRVHLKALEPTGVPEHIKKLREGLAANAADIQLCDLLLEVDGWIGFSKHCRTLAGHRGRAVEFDRALLTALTAEGCNLGMTKMVSLAPGVNLRLLRRIREHHLHRETLQALIDELVKAQHRLPIAGWLGDERVSMSDGMRIASRVGTMRAAYMPAYFAPGERGLTFYTHVSHQGPAFGAQVIGNERDATYVIDSILHVQSELPIREHYTDTHGFTEIVFALSNLFSIDFCPRIKGMHDQQLYGPPGADICGPLAEHFEGALNLEFIENHWDDIVRTVASIRRGVTSSVLLCQRLSSYAKQNPLYRSLRELGRLFKTDFILRYYAEPHLRRRIHVGLNRMEAFNGLMRHLFFGRQGQNWERDLEHQANRASALTVLANAVVLWNSVQQTRVIKLLRAEGYKPEPQDFQRISPYAHEHVLPYGQYIFDMRRRRNRNAFVQAHVL